MTKLICTTVLLIVFSATNLFGQNEGKLLDEFNIEPVIINAEDNDKTGLGLKYSVTGTFLKEILTSPDDSEEIDPDVVISSLDIRYNSDGIFLIDEKSNPLDFTESFVSGNFLYSNNIFSMLGGIFYKYENDQEFKNKQSEVGLKLVVAKYGFAGLNNYIAFSNSIGSINPINDTLRTNILTGSTEAFYRWDFEFLLSINIGLAEMETLEFNYRFFKELSPPDEIKNAGIDQFSLATLRLGFLNNLFVAYSYGRLPFDKGDDKIFEIGFSYKLQE